MGFSPLKETTAIWGKENPCLIMVKRLKNECGDRDHSGRLTPPAERGPQGRSTMTCRQCRGIEQFFDQKEASRELKGYREKGPAKSTQMLIDAIEADGIEDKTLLDIGGGVGAIQHELRPPPPRRSRGTPRGYPATCFRPLATTYRTGKRLCS